MVGITELTFTKSILAIPGDLNVVILNGLGKTTDSSGKELDCGGLHDRVASLSYTAR